MTVRRRWVLRLAGGAAAIVAMAMVVLMPEAAVDTGPLEATGGATVVRGAFHIHSVRSDGSGTVDEIAAAAARAGLQFIILTDHGDGTRPPDPPVYRDGVLTIDAVEISTSGGHYAALGLPAAPYRLAGTPEDVIEDVHRLGGFGVAAHPGSPKPLLRWEAWDAPFDGLEWINADSEWRDESWAPMLRSLFTFTARGRESMAALLDRPADIMRRWDAITKTRRVITIAGADAHARVGLARTDPDPSAIQVPLPGYETTFRTFSNHVVLDGPMSGNAAIDAPHLLDAIRQGRVFTVIDGLATPGGLRFAAARGAGVAQMGEALTGGGPAVLRGRVSAPAGATITLVRNGEGRTVAAADLDAGVTVDSGVYRLEVMLASAPGTPPVPWIVSNPIYIDLPPPSAVPALDVPASRIPARTSEASPESGPGDTSTVVLSNPRSGAIAGDPPAVWTFVLSHVPPNPFAAIRIPVTGGLALFDRVRFTVSADRPIRAWTQLRTAGAAAERWGRTFYADDQPRTIDLRLGQFQPIGRTSVAAPPLDAVDSLLFVVDWLNNPPGSKGTITLSNVSFVR
jgi:hypothetical protein